MLKESRLSVKKPNLHRLLVAVAGHDSLGSSELPLRALRSSSAVENIVDVDIF